MRLRRQLSSQEIGNQKMTALVQRRMEMESGAGNQRWYTLEPLSAFLTKGMRYE